MNPKPKILVFAHEQYLNGASHSLLSLLIGLKDQYEFLVIVPEQGLMVEALIENGINYKLLHLPRCGYFNYISVTDHIKKTIRYYKNKNFLFKELVTISQGFHPNIIYTNTSVLSVGYDLAKKTGTPHVWHIREYGDKDFNIHYIPFRKYIVKLIKKSNCSIFTTNLLKKHWLGDGVKNAKVVYNGVFETNTIKTNSTPILEKPEITIGIVGMVIETKAQDEAIAILELVSKANCKVKLGIYGAVSMIQYKNQLDKMIVDYGLQDRVAFMGYAPVNEIYETIDVLLSCAKNEGFGRTIIEAMSNGIPVVSKNSGGPTEIIKEGYDGFLYTTIQEASDKICSLLNNPLLFDTISKNALISAENNFSKKNYILNMNTIFKNQLNAKSN